MSRVGRGRKCLLNRIIPFPAFLAQWEEIQLSKAGTRRPKRVNTIMKYDHEHIVSRIGEKGYLDLVAVFLSLGFENVHDVPEALWSAAVALYEQNMFRDVA